MFAHTNFDAAVSDFDDTSVQLIFTSTNLLMEDIVQCVNISILVDDAVEGVEHFTISLSTPDPNVILNIGSATVAIQDVVSFSLKNLPDTYTVNLVLCLIFCRPLYHVLKF